MPRLHLWLFCVVNQSSEIVFFRIIDQEGKSKISINAISGSRSKRKKPSQELTKSKQEETSPEESSESLSESEEESAATASVASKLCCKNDEQTVADKFTKKISKADEAKTSSEESHSEKQGCLKSEKLVTSQRMQKSKPAVYVPVARPPEIQVR